MAPLPRFKVPGVSGSKVILLRKNTNVFQIFFSSSLGSKKLRFVHTTKLASDCMWKAHVLAGKMRRTTFQLSHLTLSYGIFQVNRNTIPEFSQILSQQFSTFHSTLVVNYPNQAPFKWNRITSTAFFYLSAY